MRRLTTFLLFLCHSVVAAEQESLTVVTEHWPPYQVVENGISTSGFSTEVVKAMLEEAGTPLTIRGFNWARAYKMALERPNVMVFGLFRSQEREKQFKWVGKIIRQVNTLWYIEGRKELQIDTLAQAKLFKIAVPREDIRHQFLLNQGFKQHQNIIVVRDHLQAVSMLFLRRTDFVISDKLNIDLTAKLVGFDPEQLRQVPDIEISLGDLYVACSLKTPDHIVEKYQQALERIKKKGIVAKLKQHYLPNHRY